MESHAPVVDFRESSGSGRRCERPLLDLGKGIQGIPRLCLKRIFRVGAHEADDGTSIFNVVVQDEKAAVLGRVVDMDCNVEPEELADKGLVEDEPVGAVREGPALFHAPARQPFQCFGVPLPEHALEIRAAVVRQDLKPLPKLLAEDRTKLPVGNGEHGPFSRLFHALCPVVREGQIARMVEEFPELPFPEVVLPQVVLPQVVVPQVVVPQVLFPRVVRLPGCGFFEEDAAVVEFQVEVERNGAACQKEGHAVLNLGERWLVAEVSRRLALPVSTQ